MADRTQKEFRRESVEEELAKREVKRELTILEQWGITPEYLTKVVFENPSLRGMIVGYIAERKLRELFEQDGRVTNLRKDDDHDREKKGDLVVTYKGFDFKLEVKSLQTNSISLISREGIRIPLIQKVRQGVTIQGKPRYKYVRNRALDEIPHAERLASSYVGKLQCDASDRRTIGLANGAKLETTCLLVGEFDILAAGLFSFRETWDFGFALNRDLPRSTYAKYPEEVRQQLLASLIPVAWPLTAPFVSDPFILLDRLVKERRRKTP